VQLKDASVGKDREMWGEVLKKSCERILDLEATGHLMQDQSVHLLRIAHGSALTLARL